MKQRKDQDRKMISYVRGRRGRVSILDCLLTALSRNKSEGPWPQCTLGQLREQVSALRATEVPEATVRSVVYRAGLFERSPGSSERVKWTLNAKGRQVVAAARRASDHPEA